MFEHRSAPLLPRRQFFLRLARSTLLGCGLVAGSLALGVTGYRFIGGLAWIDALLNASMILTGMGPVNPMTSDASKLFASFYALFSGVAFLTIVGVLLAPIVHRFFHHFHLIAGEEPSEGD